MEDSQARKVPAQEGSMGSRLDLLGTNETASAGTLDGAEEGQEHQRDGGH